MTLTEYKTLEQGSDEWLDVRRGMVTASTVGQLVTPKTVKPASNDYSRALIATLAAERITGWTDPTFVNFDMQRGIDDEPVARDLYSEHYAPAVELGFMVEDKWGFRLGYSPDGLVGDDGLIEIKSRKPKKHLQTVLADEVPLENVAQLQAGLLVSGREWIDYVSFCGGMPLYVKRVEPDERWQSALVEACQAAEESIEQMVQTYRGRVVGLPVTERTTYERLELVL